MIWEAWRWYQKFKTLRMIENIYKRLDKLEKDMRKEDEDGVNSEEPTIEVVEEEKKEDVEMEYKEFVVKTCHEEGMERRKE